MDMFISAFEFIFVDCWGWLTIFFAIAIVSRIGLKVVELFCALKASLSSNGPRSYPPVFFVKRIYVQVWMDNLGQLNPALEFMMALLSAKNVTRSHMSTSLLCPWSTINLDLLLSVLGWRSKLFCCQEETFLQVNHPGFRRF